MRTIIITFTHEGMKVAKKASEAMDGEVIIYCHQRCADTYKNEAVPFVAVGSVIKSEFAVSDRILFVCAVAIAVRTIAPYLISKVTDPAVLVADEGGKYLISLLSGHIGRANEWCNKLAVRIGAMPVITTATDARGMFAVDIFATEHNMRIVNPVMIKDISGRILNNEPVGITGNDKYKNLLKVTEERWNGQIKYTDNSNNEYESGVQIITGKDDKIVFKRTLKLVPQELAVGIGCKKGKSAHEIERAVKKTFDKTYTPEYLRDVEGDFVSSAFVEEQIGVGNVCERSAGAASSGGEKLVGKTADNGVTVAIYRVAQKNKE